LYIHRIGLKSRARHRGQALSKKDVKPGGKKNSQLVLRLDKDERDAFVERCKALDTSAAREIRRFIREFMEETRGA